MLVARGAGAPFSREDFSMKTTLAAAVLFALIAASPAYAQLAPPNDAGVTYGHVHLNVKDVELHKKLWAEHFGGVVVQKGPLTAVKFPGFLIALTQREPTGGSMGTVMDHFGFKVKDLQSILTKWRAAGYEVQSEFTGAEGFPNAYLMGPDGVRIELQEDKTQAVPVIGYHIHFQTPDYVKLLDWYVDTFGLTKRKRGNIDTTADAPGMNLSFATSRTPTVGTKGRAIDHIGFELKDLASFVKKLEAKGIKLDVPYREVPAIGLKIAYITDPSGVYIELTEGYAQY
jgi:catechol 2,3-dioxygenase-like lactoylglutathione lyase family enzyme